jgi:RNA polymerase sigma-70 factor, ECF subfamily
VQPTQGETTSSDELRAVTLGDVLYADPTRASPAEGEWCALVRAVAGGDQSALRSLYDRVHRIVFTLSLRITRDREAAEEVSLDVFHDVWRRAAAYDPANGTVVGWIMNLTRSRAIDRRRFEQREKRVPGGKLAPPSRESEREPFEQLQGLDQGRVLREALTQLTAEERQAIEIAFFSELSYAETAARLGEPLGTVKSRIRSGLEKLRQSLAERERGA